MDIKSLEDAFFGVGEGSVLGPFFFFSIEFQDGQSI